MAADNQTTIAGNLVDTPELRFTNTGIPVTVPARRRHPACPARRRVARRRDLLQGQRVARPGRTPGRLPAKGDRVMVTGRLRQRTWETPEGEKRSVSEIEADEVGASLKFATAKVERAVDPGNGDRVKGRDRFSPNAAVAMATEGPPSGSPFKRKPRTSVWASAGPARPAVGVTWRVVEWVVIAAGRIDRSARRVCMPGLNSMKVSVMLRAPNLWAITEAKARSLRNTDKALVTPAHGPRETRTHKMSTRVIG